MGRDLELTDRLRENARVNGTLGNIRAYYRQIAAEHQAHTWLPHEVVLQNALAGRRPETQTAASARP